MRRSLVAFAAVAACLMACSAILGLEDHDPPIDATDATDGPADASVPDTFVRVDRCDAATDCPKLTNRCYPTPRCLENTCVYPVCDVGEVCTSGVCTDASICAPASTKHKFNATSYALDDSVHLGCLTERNPAEDCVAAAFPFVFIGTTTGVVALRADDFTAQEPTPVPVEADGVAVVPKHIVVSGRRVWILGTPTGGTLPIAWIDVPGDPTTKALRQVGRVISYPQSPVVGFAAPNGGLFLVHNGPEGVRAAVVTAPLVDNAVAEAGPVPISEGGVVVAARGEGLVEYRATSSRATYNVIVGASVSDDETFQPDAGFFIGSPTFGSGPNGSVFVSQPVADPPDADCRGTSHASVAWLYPETTATGPILTDKYVANTSTDASCAVYPPAGYVQPDSFATFIDPRTVLLVASHGNPYPPGTGDGSADVWLVHGDDPSASTRVQTDGSFGSDRIGLTSSSGFGYLVVGDDAGSHLTLTIFDPSCPP